MNFDIIDINLIKPNSKNPRIIKDGKFKKLIKSIKESEWMLNIRPIIIDENNIILGGNMRFAAAKEAGLLNVPVIKANKLTEEQKKEFIIKDNLGFGEWDWDILHEEWDADLLNSHGLDVIIESDDDISSLEDLHDENRFSIIVECISELEQKKVFDEFQQRGFECKLIA
jgi:ParB-like chromosome segregation protein Spo0J